MVVDRVEQVAAQSAKLRDDRFFQRDLVKALTIEARLTTDTGEKARACATYVRAMRMADQSYPPREWVASDRAWFEASAKAIGGCG